jgi:hypothetical protein
LSELARRAIEETEDTSDGNVDVTVANVPVPTTTWLTLHPIEVVVVVVVVVVEDKTVEVDVVTRSQPTRLHSLLPSSFSKLVLLTTELGDAAVVTGTVTGAVTAACGSAAVY